MLPEFRSFVMPFSKSSRAFEILPAWKYPQPRSASASPITPRLGLPGFKQESVLWIGRKVRLQDQPERFREKQSINSGIHLVLPELRHSREITILGSAKVTQHHARAGALLPPGKAVCRWQTTEEPGPRSNSRLADRLNLCMPRAEQVTRRRRGMMERQTARPRRG
jgi:hypothetical protein